MTEHMVARLSDVDRTYGNPPTHALRGVSVEIREGEFVAIVGPSGSGKSTLMNILGTLDRPDSGTVAIDGSDVSTFTDSELSALRAHSIGFIFQQFHLQPGLTAVDNVADGLLYTGLTRTRRRQRAMRALISVGLDRRLRHRPAQLSGGERQRVAIARAIAGKPSLVLADEPTGNLDSTSGKGVMASLHALNRTGATIVMITHDRELAAGLSRRITMKDGVVTGDESTV